MFRRSKADEPATQPTASPAGTTTGSGKGRPTPTRREAEAAAKARARAVTDSKEARRQARDKRAAESRRMREGMKNGDERYLMSRDKGPVKRFIRDFVDARVSIAEFLLPLLLLTFVLQASGNAALVRFGGALWTTTILVVLIDTVWLVFRLKRALRERFPEESQRGTVFYAVLRALQVRPLRSPKPKVRIGGRPK
ncbi:DUF3043 domain-containing protein [Nocardioides aurantiacus]|uniref:DUF3043 family protein n=1 Tax=Nocardioides aurantiacus TaxID=86796 RepID=A0A3N2CSB7_9ACTN|nr:DUF3043 domain-containing protein [Nocardioides aurantiacus]ROR90419.1 hypothetical protein EDD33_1259 [Nocardioides aurantiacus]